MAASEKDSSLFNVFLHQVELFSNQDVFLRDFLQISQNRIGAIGCALQIWNESQTVSSVAVGKLEGKGKRLADGLFKKFRRTLINRQSVVFDDFSENGVVSAKLRNLLAESGVKSGGVFLLESEDSQPVGALLLLFDRKRAISVHKQELIRLFIETLAFFQKRSIHFEDILELRKLVQSVVEFSTDAIILTDEFGKIEFISKQAARILKKRPASLRSQYIFHLEVPPSGELEAFIRILRRRRVLTEREIAVSLPTGRRILLVSATRIPLQRERRTILLWLIKDMTSLRQSEAELNHKKEELEDFVYSVSHDLKSPIVSIQGYFSLLREDLYEHLSETHRHYFERIEKNVHLMQKMIQDLLQLSRIGRVETEMAVYSLKKIVETALDEFHFQIEKRHIQVIVPKRMPRIRCNERYMIQLFSNLISNSIKFMGHQPEPRIEIGFRRESAEFVFWVKDNGMGIQEDSPEKLFHAFYRGTGAEKVEGTGIGLAMVKKIVQFHRGRIGIFSDPEGGTVVQFTIPEG